MTLDLLARLRIGDKARWCLHRAVPCAALLCSYSVVSADETTGNSSTNEATTSPSYRCRLSIIDGGQPRETTSTSILAANDASQSGRQDPFTANPNFDKSRWSTTPGANALSDTSDHGTRPAGQPISGDFNGDGVTEIGWFADGQWYIDLNGNGVFDRDDLWAQLGSASDQPLVGDWDGDGKADIGVFGPVDLATDGDTVGAGLPDTQNENPRDASSATHNQTVRQMQRGAGSAVRTDPVDFVLDFGPRGGQAVAGDFNGDGVDTIAVFRDGEWFIDVDGDGRPSAADLDVHFGERGDRAVVGDFDGDGIDQIGVFRNGTWLFPGGLRDEEEQNDTVILLGSEKDTPTVGDWNGDGRDEATVYSTQ